ncbi:MAG: choice-of-anchor D domain-containing protein [Alphaproteobacteria bacterium]|nr:choice-of-anchor D domain-containing protein [Alphaproteobacteria bacterium]
MNALTALLVLAACRPDTGLVDLLPRMAVAPTTVDFGEIAVPARETAPVFVTNNGRAPLEITARIEGDGTFDVPVSEATVDPSQSLTLDLGFRPTSYLPYSAELVITSNDADNPEVRVPLAGVGVDGPLPDIALDTQTLDFGEVAVGSSVSLFVTLENAGDAPLTLGTLQQAGSGAFELTTDPSNDTLGPRSEVPVVITYRPFGPAGDAGTLAFPSDDPDEPVLELVLLGNGGGDFAYPEAVIDCPATSEPPIWVDLDGSGSTDPDGLALDYTWTLLSRPVGSQEDLLNPTSPVARLFTDLAGPWEVQLVVENTLGTRSAPARCTIDAVPADDLHVELIWDTPSADLDLHLAQNGAALFGGSDDASFCNAGPSWGAAGSDDDPRLDLDDQGGYGPENMNVRAPSNDAYQVRVHYFEEHADDVVNATVRVFSYGTLAWEGQRAMVENEVWDVGIVNWPDGTFGVQSVDNYVAPARSCGP